MSARGETTSGLEIVDERRGARRLEQRLRVPEDLPCLEGHFPGMPVLPGLAQLDWALAAGSQLAGRLLAPTRIDALKFRELIRPGDAFDARVDLGEDGSTLAFEARGRGGVAASCRFRIAAEDAELGDLGVAASFPFAGEPIDARALVPHAEPMVFLDALLASDETRTICSVRAGGTLFREPDGALPGWAGLEPMAQGIAVLGGLDSRRRGEDPKLGFLLGCRRLEIRARRLDPAVEYATIATRVWGGDHGLVSFECGLFERSSGQLLLAGRINAYLPEDQAMLREGRLG